MQSSTSSGQTAEVSWGLPAPRRFRKPLAQTPSSLACTRASLPTLYSLVVPAVSRSWPSRVVSVWPGVNPDGNTVPSLCPPKKVHLYHTRKELKEHFLKIWGVVGVTAPISITPSPLSPHSTSPRLPPGSAGQLSLHWKLWGPASPCPYRAQLTSLP